MQNNILLENLAVKIQACRACRLFQGTTQAVPGEGNPGAKVFFIGEGPGFYEDKTGRPFVGRAGQLLEKTLNRIGLKREDVFIGNVVKHRPPENRDPFPDEIAACKPWLDQQLAIIKPKVIVTLGRFSLAKFIPGGKISQLHGVTRRTRDYIVIPMYHPAAALRNGEVLKSFEMDFDKNKEILTQPESFQDEDSSPEDSDENQIKLF